MVRSNLSAECKRALVFVASALFLSGVSAEDQTRSLAEELFAEGDWRAARVEALRWLQQDPAHPVARRIADATAPDAGPEPVASPTRTFWAGWAQWPVRFYQTQIGPAIGQRCSMHPSCSAYCAEALRRYGWIGIPMTTDRLVRETDHVNYRLQPVWINGEERYYNPVDAHSFWFRRYRR